MHLLQAIYRAHPDLLHAVLLLGSIGFVGFAAWNVARAAGGGPSLDDLWDDYAPSMTPDALGTKREREAQAARDARAASERDAEIFRAMQRIHGRRADNQRVS